ncbi:hypothetical protein ABH922_004346 [Rhodococcus sp. 27YEA15]|uniref:hypothetical protein n=1 Tax=Rhodococcus sp. 27YEA15 TaxID=3156259 RepID=UPI003C7C4D7C
MRQYDGTGLRGEALDIVRSRHAVQSQWVSVVTGLFTRSVIGRGGFRDLAVRLCGERARR